MLEALHLTQGVKQKKNYYQVEQIYLDITMKSVGLNWKFFSFKLFTHTKFLLSDGSVTLIRKNCLTSGELKGVIQSLILQACLAFLEHFFLNIEHTQF